MMTPARLLAAMDTTWPAAQTVLFEGWILRRGEGGGQRVSAASALAGFEPEPLLAETEMIRWGQTPLFRLTPDDAGLDADLGAAGYACHDPVAVYAAPVAALTDDRDETARVIRVSTPLQLVDEIWEAGGVDAARRAVMDRAAGPKTVLMVRLGDRPAGCAFVCCDRDVAMIHAMQVVAPRRREGAGAMLMHGAANWAAEQGAGTLALSVTEANTPARALYEGMGLTVSTRYHYRVKPG